MELETGSDRDKEKSKPFDEIIRLPIRLLTPESFAPYGKVLENGKPVYPDVSDDRMELRLYHLRMKPKFITQMAFHDSYNQSFIVTKGALVMVVTRPVGARPNPKDAIDYDHLAAFLIEAGQVAMIDHGVGHFAVPVADVCQVINVTRKHRPEQHDIEEIVEGRPGRMASMAEIEFVDFGKVDNKAIVIEFQE
jgi:ureidoglycolate hydrolase